MSMRPDKWQPEKTEYLIKLLKAHPSLWNSKSYDYRNIEAREKSYFAIARHMKVRKDQIQKKILSLRSQYNRELRNMNNRDCQSKWIYFESLKFLNDYEINSNNVCDPLDSDDTQEGRIRSNGDLKSEHMYSPESDDVDQIAEEFLDAFEKEEQNNSICDPTNVEGMEYETDLPEPKKQRFNFDKYKQSRNGRSDKSTSVFLMKPQPKLRDEYSIFGEHVASELRLLNNKKNLQKSLKCAILQAILDVNRILQEELQC